MNQSRVMSLIEACVNTAIGFGISLGTWVFFVAPFFEIEVTMTDNLLITLIFTVVSIIRGYYVRRGFDAYHHSEFYRRLSATDRR